MRFSKSCKLIFFLLLLFLLLGANFVFALEINYPNIPGSVPPQDFIETAPPEEIPSLYVKYIINFSIWAGGIIALGILIYAGIRYLISTGKPEAITSAKEQISSAFLGLLLLLFSFLILNTLNPQFTILEIPKPEPVEVIERIPVPPPPAKSLLTSINTEIPFGRIIETILEEPEEEQPRMERIKINALLTKEIADKLKEQNEEIKEYTEECECSGDIVPDPPCNQGGLGNCPPEPAECAGGDPCESVRENIQEREEKNQEEISKLIIEQIKTEEEARLLKKELSKLERAKELILECYEMLDSLAGFLVTKDFFAAEENILREIKFWDEIPIKGDWASFYCPVSGSSWGERYTALPFEITEGEEEELEITGIERKMACPTEIPVGEIIDRTLEIGNLLVEKLEKLAELDKKMIDAVDNMHILVSQCSSRRCEPDCGLRCTRYRCVRLHCDEDGECQCLEWKCVERQCQGEECFGNPCPEEIAEQLEKIQSIQEEIKNVTEGKEETGEETAEERIENIGLISIANKNIPQKILEDLELIREKMGSCVWDISPDISWEQSPLEGQDTLFTCKGAIRASDPEGIIIQNCCSEEPPFKECLRLCSLEKGEKNYKQCLQDCLIEKSEGLENAGEKEESEIIKTCRHKLNFYCCGG